MPGILSEAVCECPSPKAHSGGFLMQPSYKLLLFSREPLWGGITSVLGMCRECNSHILPYAPTLTTSQALTIVSFQQPGKLAVGDDLHPLGLHPTNTI